MRSEVTWLCPTCGEVRQHPYVLLDGHHRYAICQRHEMPFDIVEAPAWVTTREEASIWIIQNQLGRRNLEDYQRIELAERLRPLLEQRAKAKQRTGGREKVPQTFAQPAETRQAIADMVGVSRETVRKAEIIMQEANEPIKQALRRGERSIQSVYHELRPPRPQPTASMNDEEAAAHPPLARQETRPPSHRYQNAEAHIRLTWARPDITA
jgi:ParB-like chromosome segregation protein Spo0J